MLLYLKYFFFFLRYARNSMYECYKCDVINLNRICKLLEYLIEFNLGEILYGGYQTASHCLKRCVVRYLSNCRRSFSTKNNRIIRIEVLHGGYQTASHCLKRCVVRYLSNCRRSIITKSIQIKLNAECSLNRSTSCGGFNFLGLLTLISIQEYEDLNNTKQSWRIITIIKV